MHDANVFAVNLFICALIATLRLCGVETPAFQAIAHLYIGALFAYGWMRGEDLDVYNASSYQPVKVLRVNHWYFRLALLISFVELYAALHQRGLIPF